MYWIKSGSVVKFQRFKNRMSGDSIPEKLITTTILHAIESMEFMLGDGDTFYPPNGSLHLIYLSATRGSDSPSSLTALTRNVYS